VIHYRMPEIRDLNTIKYLEIECMNELKNKIQGEFPVFDERHNNEANLLSIIEGGCGCAFIAEESEDHAKAELVGAIIAIDEDMKTVDEEDHNKLFVCNVFVHENYRKQGIAHKLLEMLQEWARIHNYKGIKTLMYTPNDEAKKILSDNSYFVISEIREKTLV
jgi:GNAT superfamily N-acetyltransferase